MMRLRGARAARPRDMRSPAQLQSPLRLKHDPVDDLWPYLRMCVPPDEDAEVLQANSVTAASFNFKKRTNNYHVWFTLLIPRETNLKIIQRLSEIPEITQVESGTSESENVSAVSSSNGDAEGGHLR